MKVIPFQSAGTIVTIRLMVYGYRLWTQEIKELLLTDKMPRSIYVLHSL